MRRWLSVLPLRANRVRAVAIASLLAASLLAAPGLTGCVEEDPAPRYLDIRYQLRCLDCEPRSPDDPVRDIAQLDGENDLQIECSARTSGEDRLVTFAVTSVEDDDREYSFGISNANIDKTNPGGDCRVLVQEGSNTYEGRCTDDDPSDSRPCQLDFDEEDGIVSGSVRCLRIPNRRNSQTQRYLVEPGSDDDEIEFEVHGCTGL